MTAEKAAATGVSSGILSFEQGRFGRTQNEKRSPLILTAVEALSNPLTRRGFSDVLRETLASRATGNGIKIAAIDIEQKDLKSYQTQAYEGAHVSDWGRSVVEVQFTLPKAINFTPELLESLRQFVCYEIGYHRTTGDPKKLEGYETRATWEYADTDNRDMVLQKPGVPTEYKSQEGPGLKEKRRRDPRTGTVMYIGDKDWLSMAHDDAFVPQHEQDDASSAINCLLIATERPKNPLSEEYFKTGEDRKFLELSDISTNSNKVTLRVGKTFDTELELMYVALLLADILEGREVYRNTGEIAGSFGVTYRDDIVSLHQALMKKRQTDVGSEAIPGLEEQYRKLHTHIIDPLAVGKLRGVKGALLVGAPGTGKTLLSRFIEQEENPGVLVCNISESDVGDVVKLTEKLGTFAARFNVPVVANIQDAHRLLKDKERRPALLELTGSESQQKGVWFNLTANELPEDLTGEDQALLSRFLKLPFFIKLSKEDSVAGMKRNYALLEGERATFYSSQKVWDYVANALDGYPMRAHVDTITALDQLLDAYNGSGVSKRILRKLTDEALELTRKSYNITSLQQVEMALTTEDGGLPYRRSRAGFIPDRDTPKEGDDLIYKSSSFTRVSK